MPAPGFHRFHDLGLTSMRPEESDNGLNTDSSLEDEDSGVEPGDSTVLAKKMEQF